MYVTFSIRDIQLSLYTSLHLAFRREVADINYLEQKPKYWQKEQKENLIWVKGSPWAYRFTIMLLYICKFSSLHLRIGVLDVEIVQ